MIESLDSHLKQQKPEQYTGQLQPTWSDKGDAKLFAKPSSTASLDNLNTAALYHSDTNGLRAFRASERSVGNDSSTSQRSAESAGARQSEHKVKVGETLEGVARKKLGPNATDEEVKRYSDYVAKINNLIDENGNNEEPKTGKSLRLPGRAADNSLTYTNPDNRNETWQLKADGTSNHRMPLDKHGSYFEQHEGPNPQDNYDLTYNHKENTSIVRREAENGDVVKTAFRGTDIGTAPQATKVIHENGDWEETCGPDSQVSSSRFVKAENKRVDNFKDGSVVTTFIKGTGDESKIDHTETVQKEGAETVKTTKQPDGSYSVERSDEKGTVTSRMDRKYFNNGGYSEFGTYTKDGKACSYTEQFDAKTGTTRRSEHTQGADGNTIITSTKDGTVTVDSPDGTRKTTRKDGSEVVEKNGTKISEKPAYDYKNNPELNKSKEELNNSINAHIPANRQAAFRRDMAAFEERAAKEHLSPEQITKSYQQMSKMLNATEAVMPATDRAILAESLMHQCAQPQDTHQGRHNTCNVTSVAENTLVKNPDKAVEMAATTAVTGKWTAPDGKVITIDQASLKPGSEEQTYPPAKDGNRTFATQVLNLVMVNDALQRRNPPQSYVQAAPETPSDPHDKRAPVDTGERTLDANGNVVKDNSGRPISGPDITTSDIAQVSKRLNGANAHVIDFTTGQGSVDSVLNENQLRHRLSQFKQQGHFPITLGVDGAHWPITGIEQPGYGGHVVTIDGYDEKTGKVHVTNQWGQRSNRWVTIGDLWENSSGKTAWDKDGTNDTDW